MYGLIGYPLGHSFSKEFFTKKFASEKIRKAEYQNFPLQDIKEFPGFIKSMPQLQGLNVTIPYKEKIMPYLHFIDPVAAEIGAVNTIRFDKEGKQVILHGFNTDNYGFRRSLEEIIPVNLKIKKALILGTGGASKAVAWVLNRMGVEYQYVSTSSKSALAYNDLNRNIIGNCQLIVNSSPLGTFPNVSEFPAIPYEYINEAHVLFDLVYNPALTVFLKKGMEQGATISNGLKMLEYQALKSWEIWNSV
jgi:shikimate dehydrogenase